MHISSISKFGVVFDYTFLDNSSLTFAAAVVFLGVVNGTALFDDLAQSDI